jgi:hypothetical protein
MATRPKTKKQKKEANKPTTPAGLRIAKSQKF